MYFKCNCLFNCRLQFNNMVLRMLFGSKMEKLTGGWRKFQWDLGEWDLWCMWDVSGKWIWVKEIVWKSEGSVYNIRTYLRGFGSGMSTGLIWLSIGATTIPARGMLSVHDSETAIQIAVPEFVECSCSVPLVLSNTVLYLCEQVADIRLRQTGSVVTTLTGNPARYTDS